MQRARPWIGLILGGVILLLGRDAIARLTDQDTLYRYGFEWFLKLSPLEISFLWRYAVYGGLGAGLIAWGLTPLLRGRMRAGEILSAPGMRFLPALVGTVLVLVIGFGVLNDHVVTDDEYTYAFQARAILSGRAALPAPEMPEFFRNVFVAAENGRWFGQYPPGHPIFLAPGVAMGIPRVMPALLIAVNILLTTLVLRRLVEEPWAVAGGLLLVASPLFVMTGSTLLSHSTAYLGLTLGTLGALHAMESHRVRWGVLAGLGVGLLFLARPWTGVTLGLFPAVMLVHASIRTGKWGALLGAAGASLACLALFFLYNWDATGNPALTGYEAVRGPGRSEFGFGTIVPNLHDHTVGQGVKNAMILGFRFYFWSAGWALVLLPALFALGGAPRTGRVLGERALVWGALGMLVVGLLSYIPYWSVGVNDTGPVKTYELLLPFGVLTTVGARRWAQTRGGAPVAGWAAGSLLAGLALFWPVQIQHLDALARRIADPLELVESTVEVPALVFVSSMQAKPGGSWVFGYPNPQPDLGDPILYVHDIGRSNLEYMKLHPERRAYRLIFEESEPVLVPLPGGRRK